MTRLLMTAAAGALALGGTTLAQSSKSATAPKPRFVACDTLLDAKVKSRADRDETANVDDIVVDTRTGRAAYVLIDTNGILETENRVVAVPYGALTWNDGAGSFWLEMKATELRSLPPCDPSALGALHEDSWVSTLKGIFGDRQEIRDLTKNHGDEYTMWFKTERPRTLEGNVVAINRKAETARGGSYYAVIVEELGSEARHTVFLAPMPHLTRQAALPDEGDTIRVTAIDAYDADGTAILVAETLRTSDTTVRLRDEQGVPSWSSQLPRNGSYFMLASTMDDGALFARGKKFGSVSDAVFEVNSGAAAFAIVSVGGLLGVDDTLYPIPCGAFALSGKSNLAIDMPVSKLEVAPKLSKEGLDDLNDAGFAKRVCDYYGVEPKPFDTARSARWSTTSR